MTRRLTRRDALTAAGIAGAAVLLGCGEDEAASGGSAGACVLSPESTEGPYYISDSMIRRDITEGRPGAPLELKLTVQEAESCAPIRNATVELWHADAGGVYSGFDEGEGQKFLRGGQRTGADGIATIKTIYPGWYQGRAPHLHVKVHAGGEQVHTGQLYFDEALSRKVYASGEYARRGQADTTNSSDGIYGQGGEESTVKAARVATGYAGRIKLGVQA